MSCQLKSQSPQQPVVLEDYLYMVEAIATNFNYERIRTRDSEIFGHLSQELVSCYSRFDSSKGSFEKYLSTHLFNKAIDFVRRSKRKKRKHGCFYLNQDELKELPQEPSKEVISTDLLPTLLAESPKDTPRDIQDRSILIEYYLSGKSAIELSKKYDTTRITIYNRIKKSIHKIRENHSLSNEPGGDTCIRN